MARGRRRAGGGCGGWGCGDGSGRGGGSQSQQLAAGMSYIASKLGMGPGMSSELEEEMKRVIGLRRQPPHGDSSGTEAMEGFGPLHEAAITGKMDTCKYLVEQLWFDVNDDASNDSGMTPLACAVSHGKAIAARYFLDKGVDPNKQDNIGFTPLHYATKEGNVGMARLLISRGASVDLSSSEGTPLHVAASTGKSGIMQILLEHNADPNKVSADLGTPMFAALCYASQSLNESAVLKCMKLLVKAGADLNCTNPDTPLVVATSTGLDECVECLLEVGADANIPINHGGRTPIEIAANSGRRKLVEILLPFTSPIQAVSNWSVEGIIAHVKTRHSKDKGKQSEKDSKVQLKLCAEKPMKEDAVASKSYAEGKGSDKDKKAQLKLLGAKAVEGKDYAGASKSYSESILLDPADAALYSNRSLCYLKVGEAQDALLDANACIRLRPEWPKGYYWKGAALMSLKEYKEASDAYMAGVRLDPANSDLLEAFWEAVEAMKEHSAGRSVYSFD